MCAFMQISTIKKVKRSNLEFWPFTLTTRFIFPIGGGEKKRIQGRFIPAAMKTTEQQKHVHGHLRLEMIPPKHSLQPRHTTMRRGEVAKLRSRLWTRCLLYLSSDSC